MGSLRVSNFGETSCDGRADSHFGSRGLPMSVFAIMIMAGPGIGCVAAGGIEQNPRLEWRWIQWIHVMCVLVPFTWGTVAVTAHCAYIQLLRHLLDRIPDYHARDPARCSTETEGEDTPQEDWQHALSCARRGSES